MLDIIIVMILNIFVLNAVKDWIHGVAIRISIQHQYFYEWIPTDVLLVRSIPGTRKIFWHANAFPNSHYQEYTWRKHMNYYPILKWSSLWYRRWWYQFQWYHDRNKKTFFISNRWFQNSNWWYHFTNDNNDPKADLRQCRISCPFRDGGD